MNPEHSRDLPPEGGSHETLTAGLRAVADDDERLGTSSAVGIRLLAEVQSIADARRRRRTLLSLGAAAAVIIAALVPAWFAFQSRGGGATDGAIPVVSRELVTEFFPLTYSNVPARGGYVVRMQVPRSALAAFGIALASNDVPASGVLADVVVGDDGLARAVRFVRVISDTNPADHLRQGSGGREAGHHEQEQRP